MDKVTCKNCKWVRKIYNGDGELNCAQCCRYAPRPVEGVTDDWPYLYKAHFEQDLLFCGEFEQKEPDE